MSSPEITFHINIREVLDYCKAIFGNPSQIEITMDSVTVRYGQYITYEEK